MTHDGLPRYLVEILLPLSDNHGEPFPREHYREVSDELTERFGGLTSFTRTPADGRWLRGDRESRDDIIVIEVMTDVLHRRWWGDYRRALEERFRQEEIIIRTHPIERL